MNRVLVIGASGVIGGQVVAQLAALGASVRALTRQSQIAGLPPNVEQVVGDLTAPETLDACLDGVDAVFLVWVAPGGTVEPVIERIVRHAKSIVFLSAPIKTPHPLFQQPNPLRDLAVSLERAIEASGLEWTFLRPGMLAVNAVRWWAPQIRAEAVVRWPYLDVPTAPIDERDIAAVAVRTLSEKGHGGAEYLLTGPQSLTHAEQLAIIGEVLGRKLRVEEKSPEEARLNLVDGMPPVITNILVNAWAAAAGHPAFITHTVADVTGTPARTFRQWVTDNAAEFRN